MKRDVEIKGMKVSVYGTERCFYIFLTADADFYLILFVLYVELHPLRQAEAAPQQKAFLTFHPPRFQPIASIVGASLL